MRLPMLARLLAGFALALGLAACGAEPKWAPEADVARARYVHEAPASITLYTVISNARGEGGHTGLMISGSQRVMWDPAGTWWNPAVPERNDLHYGITPRVEEIYVDYHARETWRVVVQEVPVSRETADRIIAAFEARGASGKAMCTANTTAVLSRFAELGDVPNTWFPKRLMEYFDTLPGVKKTVVYDDDDDNNQPLLRQQIEAGVYGLR